MKRNEAKSEIKAGVILSYFQMGLSILINLLYTPVMIKTLGQSEYGLYSTVASTISMLSVLSLGFNGGYIKYYARYKKDDDTERIHKLNGLFLVIFSMIGLIALICGLFLTQNLDLVFSDGLTPDQYIIAKKLMLILTINLAVSFPMSVFSNIISANEKFVFLKLLGMLKTVVGPLVIMPLLMHGYKSVAMVIVTTVVSFITDCIYVYYVIFVLKYRFCFKDFEKGLVKGLFVYTFFIAINMVVDQVNSNVDKVLLARFRGTKEVAVYAVGYSLYSYYATFSTAVSGVFAPQIHRIIVEAKDKEREKSELTKLFTKVGRIQFLILSLVLTGVLFFGHDFIVGFWAGNTYTNSYGVSILLMLPATIPLIQNLGIEIQRAQNNHQFRSIIYLFIAILNVTLSIQLCKLYGAIGSAIGTCMAVLIGNGLIMNIFYHKKCNIDMIYFWKKIIAIIPGLLIPCLVGLILKFMLGFDSVIKFVIGAILYIVIYVISVWKFSLNEFEKSLITKFVGKNK